MRLLDRIVSTLPQTQRIAVRALLESKKRTGELRSLRAFDAEASRLAGDIRGRLGRQLLDPVYVQEGSRISSSDHNKNMEGIYLDLTALYMQVDRISRQGQLHSATLVSEYNKSRAAIQKLLTDVRVFALRKKFPDFNEVKVVDFNSSQNQSKKVPPATVNDKTRLLELLPIQQSRAHLTNRSERATKVYTRTISPGLKGSLSRDFPPDNVVDQKPETFWGNLILSDALIQQVYSRNSTATPGTSAIVAVDGPITEVFLRFSHAEKLNTVRILPFAEYPVRIVDVSYRPNLSTQIFTTMPDFEEISTLDWVELTFAPIYAQEIRITVAQENPKSVLYHLPKRVVTNTDLFHEIIRIRTSQVVGAAALESDFTSELLSTADAYSQAIGAVDELLNLSHIDIGVTPTIDYTEDFVSILNQVLQEVDPTVRADVAPYRIDEEDPNPDDEIIEVKKYEYILGIREIEATYSIYSPEAHYESEEFTVQATVSEIQMEVDDRHPLFQTVWETGLRKTSVEWEVDVGEGRTVPIHPRNQVDDVFIPPLPAVKDERIFFDKNTRAGFTRLGSKFANPTRLKKDGELIPVTEYNVKRQTSSIPTLRVALSGDWFDEDGIYTIDYVVDQDSYSIQVLDLFSSRPVDTPELFDESGPNNDIQVSKYPYIDYEVVNRTGNFLKEQNEAKWTWNPPQSDLSTGQLRIYPQVVDSLGNILITGSPSGFFITGAYGKQSGVAPITLPYSGLNTVYFNNPFSYYVTVLGINQGFEVTGFFGSTGILFATTPVLTQAQILASPTGAFSGTFTGKGVGTGFGTGDITTDFTIGVGLKTDNQVFSFFNPEYEPMTVKVGGRQARNITDYETLRHPAFSVSATSSTEYEYIQAGKKLYFNQDTEGREVSVQYNWITEYVKLLGTLRCNKSINPDLTPKVNEVRVLTNNLVI